MKQTERLIFGMVHLEALPGTPFYASGSFNKILDTAVESACALKRGGTYGCLIQTVDKVYAADDSSDPARTVALGLIVRAIVHATNSTFVVGLQIMRNAIKESLAISKVSGGHLVRATALVGSTETDHGILQSNPYEVMKYRRALDAHDVQIVADIASIHYHPVRPVGELARHARRVGADGVAVGDPDETRTLGWIKDIRRNCPEIPIFLAGHTNHENASRLLAYANGAFVGSCLEANSWGHPIIEDRVKAYMDIVLALPPLEV